MSRIFIDLKKVIIDKETLEKLKQSEELLRYDFDFMNNIMNNTSSFQNDIDEVLKIEVPGMYFICNSNLNLWIGIAESGIQKGTWFIISAHKETIY